MMAHML